MPPSIDPHVPMHAIYWLWVIWYASWLATLLWTSRSVARPSRGAQRANLVTTGIGILLLFEPPYFGWHSPQLLQPSDAERWALLPVIAVAFAFAWWARIEMGRLWNGYIARTENHRVIDTGPFALVRHPIYTAIILAALLTGIAQGTLFGIAGATFIAWGLWLKARLEERFLIGELGKEAYAAYRRRVPMLVPFWPKTA